MKKTITLQPKKGRGRPKKVKTLHEIMQNVESAMNKVPVEKFATGSVRDTQEGKLRWDLVPWETFERVVQRYTEGADHYGDENWKLGQPMKRVFASCMRHLMAYVKGERDEDHAAAAVWNLLTLMWTEDNKPELDNLHEKLNSLRNLQT